MGGTRKIALLGASGHIAKGILWKLCHPGIYELHPFARSPEKVDGFIKNARLGHTVACKPFSEFCRGSYDVVINCVGLGVPKKVKQAGYEVFRLTEEFDSLVLDYILQNPETLYINFSSGAAYVCDFDKPASNDSKTAININNITENEFYGIAKLNSEAKHRAFKHFDIVDLRIFGYFSRFIDMEAGFLLTELIMCIKGQKQFLTTDVNIMRDYLHMDDMAAAVEKCISVGKINRVFDICSSKPVSKFEVLDYFAYKYGLKYKIVKDLEVVTATRNKEFYYSTHPGAAQIGYMPTMTSMDCIVREAEAILGM